MAKPSPAFPGFSKKMPAFFRGLEKNNTREWFAPRKDLFESEVRGPMIDLVSLINQDLRGFAIDYTVAAPAKALYRIYRDTRFSKDKTPYKTHVGATFHRQGLSRTTCAGFYVGVSHKCVEVAGGMYMPGPDELAAVRQAIVDDPDTFDSVFTNRRLTKSMGPLRGERLARPPKGFEAHASSPVADHLKAKQLYWYVELSSDVALGPGVRRAVVDRFKIMAEAVEWLNAAVLARLASAESDDRPRRPTPMW